MKSLLLVFPFVFAGGVTGIVMAQQQLDNPGFETWETIRSGLEEPVGWTSLKNTDGGFFMNRLAPVGLEKCTSAHSGLYCIKLVNKTAMNIVVTGTLTNGAIHPNFDPEKGYVYTDTTDSRLHTHFSSRPDSLTGWFKFYPEGDDKIMVWAVLHTVKGSIPEFGTKKNWTADALFISKPVVYDTWTRFSIPFVYYKDLQPDYILIILNSGYGTKAIPNSVAYFDDLKLIYNPK
jgi:hypothetical protein